MIIEAANKVISHNVSQIKKTIFTENPTGEKIELIEAPGWTRRISLVVELLRGEILKIAILTRILPFYIVPTHNHVR